MAGVAPKLRTFKEILEEFVPTPKDKPCQHYYKRNSDGSMYCVDCGKFLDTGR